MLYVPVGDDLPWLRWPSEPAVTVHGSGLLCCQGDVHCVAWLTVVEGLCKEVLGFCLVSKTLAMSKSMSRSRSSQSEAGLGSSRPCQVQEITAKMP